MTDGDMSKEALGAGVIGWGWAAKA
jgi:hypothetical protein